ncbi:thioredoxin [Thraustotheca clavata]|uniref:Thioredoxin n=1 Tax=Thraustotheca clavata TaxID=74557 RepID=A0A1W0A1K0_9STRA|nr:thioredoxin [Thraustotheca clavata]
MTVQKLHFPSAQSFLNEINDNKYKDRLVAIDFSAIWCPPCQYIKPIFHDFSDELPQVDFIEIDVDESDEVAAAVGIRAMPTFQFYRNGKKVDEMTGANLAGLKQLLKQYQ